MWNWTTVLSQRLFPGRLAVPKRWLKLYGQKLGTPAVGNNQIHALKNAL